MLKEKLSGTQKGMFYESHIFYPTIIKLDILVMGIKNGANASFSVQSKIFPKLKAQILQMRYQNVQKGSGFTVTLKKF